MNAIELSHVTKHFPGFALQDLSLTVPSGTICGLVGENGAGKTTAIRLLMGALRPDSGRCTVLGTDAASPEFLAVKEDVGVVLDEAYFPESLNALQVGKVLSRTYRRWDGALYAGYLTRFDLPEKKQFKDFSRGHEDEAGHRRGAEPSSAAAGAGRGHRRPGPHRPGRGAGAVQRVHPGGGPLHPDLLHILSDLEKLCDYIAFLHKGRLLLCEEKDRLLEKYGIFTGTADQADALMPEAVAAREVSGLGGVRCLVRRDLMPAGWDLEKPTVEDVILFLVKGAKEQ